jgi:hypothetical protein
MKNQALSVSLTVSRSDCYVHVEAKSCYIFAAARQVLERRLHNASLDDDSPLQ